MKTAIIALLGPAGAGKSTVAKHLVEKYGGQRFSLAEPLKLMVQRAFNLTDEQVFGTQEQKEAVDPRYNHSARWLLQRIGTDGCRATFGEDFWTKQCLESIWRANPRLAVIEDTRFINEAALVHADTRFNGFVFRLHPVADAEAATRAAAAGAHKSELEWRDADADFEIQPAARGIPELLSIIDSAMLYIPLRDAAEGMKW